MILEIIYCVSLLFLIFRIRIELIILLKRLFSYVFQYDSVYIHRHEPDVKPVDLPIIRFQNLQERRPTDVVEETCFICSVDYERDDVVCQLSRCGHVYHSHCVGNLIQRKESECPFCRTSFFSGRPSVPTKIFR